MPPRMNVGSTLVPATWLIGATARNRGVSGISKFANTVPAKPESSRWRRSAPLDLPVVPPV